MVNKLILMGSVGLSFPITEELDLVWGYSPSFENMKRLMSTFSYDQTMVKNDNLVQLRYQASVQKGFQEAFASMFPAPRQRHVDALALNEEALKSITKPTLLIHGREDRVIPFEQTSLKMELLMPNAELHVFSKCGHWMQIEKTEPFCEQVIQFLSR